IDTNRWGDYSGIALDPSGEARFWVFNEYALARGTAFGGESGRWSTRWSSFSLGSSPIPTLSINGATVSEGPVGTTTLATFTISLSAASTQTITVDYATADGTATAGSDYVA